MCSTSRTFSVRIAETSNTLFTAVPSTSSPSHALEIVSKHAKYLESQLIPARTDRLYRLLKARAYDGPSSFSSPHQGFSEEQLLSEVQASREELLAELKSIRALKLADGCWCVLSDRYESEVLLLITSVIEIYQLDFSDFSVSLVHQKMIESQSSSDSPDQLSPRDYFPEHIVHHCICSRGKINKATDKGSIDLPKLARFHAQTTLLQKTKETEFLAYTEFFESWTARCPASYFPSREELRVRHPAPPIFFLSLTHSHTLKGNRSNRASGISRIHFLLSRN